MKRAKAFTWKEIAEVIDHTLLSMSATRGDIIRMCDEAKKEGFFSVCVNPCYVGLAKKELEKSEVKVCAVIDFPLGASTTKCKIQEALACLDDGADELDIVSNIGKLKSGEVEDFENELISIVEEIKNRNPETIVKIIVELGHLTDEERRKAAMCVAKSGADFFKTSTGYGPRPTSIEDVEFCRKTLPSRVKIKASGGIRTLDALLGMLEAGADRIGTSSAMKILEEAKRRFPE
jgi:deoxyribose-phosphate aldolase